MSVDVFVFFKETIEYECTGITGMLAVLPINCTEMLNIVYDIDKAMVFIKESLWSEDVGCIVHKGDDSNFDQAAGSPRGSHLACVH